MTRLIVIFGARIMPDGSPSRALRRRVVGAIEVAKANPDAVLFASGAAGQAGQPTEAAVMRDLLRDAGLSEARIVLDEVSRDTLQSVVAAARYAHAHRIPDCIVCSDTYHLARIQVMFALLGVRAAAGPVRSGRAEAGTAYWIKMWLREAVALPYDAAIVLARRRALMCD